MKMIGLIGLCMILVIGCKQEIQSENYVLEVKYLDNTCVAYYPKVQHYLAFENISEEECPIGRYTQNQMMEGLEELRITPNIELPI